MIKYILFDLDGTLIDFIKGEKMAFIDTIKKHMNYIPSDLECKRFSDINEYYFNEFKEGRMDRKTFHFNRFKEIYEYLKYDGDIINSNDYYINSLKYQAELYDDVLDTLNYLKNKYRLFIATNGMTSVQIKRLEIANINNYFEKNYISEDIGYNKPDIEFFNYIFNDLNDYDKDKYIIIGDRIDSDILGAINSGIKSIYLNRENNSYDNVPNYVINSLLEIKNIL
jgi:YjjG family noncanonical pyrimidine nucleotidase